MVWALLREGDGDYADTFMMILLKADKESPDQHLGRVGIPTRTEHKKHCETAL